MAWIFQEHDDWSRLSRLLNDSSIVLLNSDGLLCPAQYASCSFVPPFSKKWKKTICVITCHIVVKMDKKDKKEKKFLGNMHVLHYFQNHGLHKFSLWGGLWTLLYWHKDRIIIHFLSPIFLSLSQIITFQLSVIFSALIGMLPFELPSMWLFLTWAVNNSEEGHKSW